MNRRSVPAALGMAISVILIPSRAVTDEDTTPPDPLEERLVKTARTFQIAEKVSGRALTIGEQPLLNWINPTQEYTQRGLVYVWELDGRPVVISSAFSYVWGGVRRIKMQLHSLSQLPLEGRYEQETIWTPAPKAIKWKVPSGAPFPASDKRLRLTQMRSIARQFRLSTTNRDGEITELRLLPQPLHRYESPKNAIRDGAIFSYAAGTDPDACLMIEDVESNGSRGYRFAFARFHYIKVEAKDRGGALVWDAPADMSQLRHHMGDSTHFRKPYVTFHVDAWPAEPLDVKSDL